MGHRRPARGRFCGMASLGRGDFAASPSWKSAILSRLRLRKCRFKDIALLLSALLSTFAFGKCAFKPSKTVKRGQKGSGLWTVRSRFFQYWTGFSAILHGPETPENDKKHANPAAKMPLTARLCCRIPPGTDRNCPSGTSDNTSYRTFPVTAAP